MKQFILVVFLSMLALWVIPIYSMAEEGALDEPLAETGVVDVGIFVPQGQEETAGSGAPEKPEVHKFIDPRILEIENEAQGKIQAIVEQINQLEDKSQEGELQKEIEQIKLDAEIARLKIVMHDADERGDIDLADMLGDEIDRLENPEEPVPAEPSEQLSVIQGEKEGGK